MANQKENATNILNLINSIKSAIEFYSDSNGNVSMYLSDKSHLNIVNFIIDFFNNTEGNPFVLKKICEFISNKLQYLEYPLKASLLAYCETLLSCSVKPIINEKMILDGIYFDLQTIDLFNKLNNQPVINNTDPNNVNLPGKYLYFGCDDIQTIPDLAKCIDFDAVLWYVKNTPGKRIVWKKDKNDSPEIVNTIGNDVIYTVDYTFKFPKESDTDITVKKICKKGVDDNGQDCLYTLTGDYVGFFDDEQFKSESGYGTPVETHVSLFAHQPKSNGIVTLEYNAKSSGLTNAMHEQMFVTEPIQNCLHVFIGCCKDIELNNENVYPSAKSNYYYNHPLIEFNYDLIFSMKWFDEKVVAAQLINAITGCFEFGPGNANGLLSANMSLQERIIQYELNDVIERIIENDDDTVSDCFFTFDNDKFNSLLQASEMARIGLHTLDGVNPLNPMTPAEVFAAINSLSPNATKAELTAAIEHALFSAVSCGNHLISEEEYELNTNVSINGMYGVDFDTNLNMVEVLIKKLIYVIVSAFLTPKIYMIIMFNLKILQQTDRSFDLREYIVYCKSMFIDIVNIVKYQIVEYFKELIIATIKEFLDYFKPLMLQEQYNYYKILLQSCFDCIQIFGNEYDWSQDDVRYADITDPITSTNDEC